MDSRSPKGCKMDSKSDPRKVICWVFFGSPDPRWCKSAPRCLPECFLDAFWLANVSKMTVLKMPVPSDLSLSVPSRWESSWLIASHEYPLQTLYQNANRSFCRMLGMSSSNSALCYLSVVESMLLRSPAVTHPHRLQHERLGTWGENLRWMA